MKAAKAGLSASQRVLAHLHSEGKVAEKALSCIEVECIAAENGDFRAMARTGWMYIRGEGADTDRVKGLDIYGLLLMWAMPSTRFPVRAC